jgi:hypothetical protein
MPLAQPVPVRRFLQVVSDPVYDVCKIRQLALA